MRMNTDFEQTASDGNYDDESTSQPPPSDTGSVADIDIDDDVDEEAPTVQHDQLPSPEEYKAKMNDVGKRDNPQDGDDDNGVGGGNTLPSVDEYKSSMSFRQNSTSSSSDNKKSRAGLFTFLGLLLMTVIVTS